MPRCSAFAKRIALPPDVDDFQAGAGRSQLAPQPVQGHVQRIGRDHAGHAPGGSLQRGAAHGGTGLAHQAEHDLQFGRRQGDGGARALHAAFLRADADIAQHRRQFPHQGRAAQQGAHAGDQLLHGKGLGEVVVRAGLQAAHAVAERIAGREHEAGCGAACGAQPLHQFQAVAIGQAAVDDQHAVVDLLQGQPGRGDLVENVGLYAGVGQRAADERRQPGVVLN
jgi:hypothetical protein